MDDRTVYHYNKGFWSPELQKVMEAAAVEVLRRLGCNNQFVTKDDLVSEAWLTSGRRGSPQTMKRQYVWSIMHMWRAYRRLVTHNKPNSKKDEPSVVRMTHIELDSLWHADRNLMSIESLELMHLVCRTERDYDIVTRRLCGSTLKEIGIDYGVTRECVRLWLKKIKNRTQLVLGVLEN